MSCKAYRKALVDAAAGSAIEAAAQAHLAACQECAAALAGEQGLFAAVDAGVSRLVSSEPPPSLVPRVRESVAQERVASRRFGLARAWAPAAAVVALILAAFLPRIFDPSRAPEVRVVLVSTPKPSNSDTASAGTHAARSIPRDLNPVRATSRARHANVLRAVRNAGSEPEVLVSPTEKSALVRYAAVLRRRGDMAQALINSQKAASMEIEPLEIAAMEWPEFSIKPLVVEDREEVSK